MQNWELTDANSIAEKYLEVAPRPEVRYHGELLIAHGIYGNTVCIRCSLGDLEQSPFLQADIESFLKQFDTPGLFKWKGYYIKHEDCSYDFVGKVKEVKWCF